MLRQGDVLLISTAIPKEAKRCKAVDGRNVLAEGEATGHAHTVDAGASVLLEAPDGRRFLRVKKETQLTHQEHDAIAIWPQEFEVRRQREYSPEEVRRVLD